MPDADNLDPTLAELQALADMYLVPVRVQPSGSIPGAYLAVLRQPRAESGSLVQVLGRTAPEAEQMLAWLGRRPGSPAAPPPSSEEEWGDNWRSPPVRRVRRSRQRPTTPVADPEQPIREEHLRRFTRLVKQLDHLLDEMRAYCPAAEYYLANATFCLLNGPHHAGNPYPQPLQENIVAEARLRADNGDW